MSANFFFSASRLEPVSMSAETLVESALMAAFPALHKALPERRVNCAVTASMERPSTCGAGKREDRAAFGQDKSTVLHRLSDL